MSISELSQNNVLLGIIALLLLVAINLFLGLYRRRKAQTIFALQRRSKLLTASEKSFFECLSIALSDEFYVLTKVAILDVVEASPRAGILECRRIKKMLLRESFGYVLCKKHDLSIFGIAELEDFDKKGNKGNESREALIGSICKSAHLKLFYFDARQDYRGADIKRLVTGRSSPKRKRPANETGQPSHMTVGNSDYQMYAKNRCCPQCNGELVTKVAIKGKHIGEKFLLCRKYPYCDYRTHVSDKKISNMQESVAQTKPAYKDCSAN